MALHGFPTVDEVRKYRRQRTRGCLIGTEPARGSGKLRENDAKSHLTAQGERGSDAEKPDALRSLLPPLGV